MARQYNKLPFVLHDIYRDALGLKKEASPRILLLATRLAVD